MKTTRNLISCASAYIDPLGCNSTVSYKIIKNSRRVWATVQLSDCSEKIEWYFSGDGKQDIDKIDKAISVLQEFRDNFAAAKMKRKPSRAATK